MNQKLRLGLILGTVVLVIVGTATFFYYQTKVTESCDKVLEKYESNHLCISTNKGVMVFKLRPESGPKAVERMKSLSNEKKFYDNLEFYRIVKDFVIQGGIQGFKQETAGATQFDTATQTKLNEYDNKFNVETNMNQLGFSAEDIAALEQEGYVNDQTITAKKLAYGDISFANAGADSNSSEFYVVTSKDENSEGIKGLNGKFTNFGSIVEGQSVLDSLNSISADATTGIPSQKITIFEMRVK